MASTSSKSGGIPPTQSSGSALPRNSGVKPSSAKCQTGSRSAQQAKSQRDKNHPKARRGQDQQPGGKPGWYQATSKNFHRSKITSLMETIADLRKQVQTLTARLDATTKQGKRGKPTMPNGARPCITRKACSLPTIKNVGVSSRGRAASVAAIVTTDARAGHKKLSCNTRPNGTPKRQSSTASLATVSPTPTSGQSGCPVDPPESPVDATSEVARDLPVFGGASYAATVSAGKVKPSDKPVFALSPPKMVSFAPIPLVEKQSYREREHTLKVIDEECHYYLLSEFAFLERTPATLRAMQQKLSKHLAKFDQARLTSEERYRLIIGSVAHAMAIPQQEQKVRALLKNSVMLEEIGKHNKFVTEGMVGHVRGLFGTRQAKVMPTASKST